MRAPAYNTAKMAGIPNVPASMRELMAVTATDDECRQWLVQQQILAADMQCACGAVRILQRFSRSADRKVRLRSCLIIIATPSLPRAAPGHRRKLVKISGGLEARGS